MESKLKITFESLDHVSTTADIWSANNKSYLEVTVHLIDSASLYGRRRLSPVRGLEEDTMS